MPTFAQPVQVSSRMVLSPRAMAASAVPSSSLPALNSIYGIKRDYPALFPTKVAAAKAVTYSPCASNNVLQHISPLTTSPEGSHLNVPMPEEALPSASGYLPISTSTPESRMFFAYYEATEPSRSLAETPLLLWLNGGPGCSSMIGNFYEIGPWKVAITDDDIDSLRLEKNPWAWNRKYGLLFIDNPIGTGFSIAESIEDIPQDQPTVAKHLFYALSTFFDMHPSLRGRPFFVTGESYAGKYVPELGCLVMQQQQRGQGLPVKFAGIVVGNGFTDPRIQVQVHEHVARAFSMLTGQQADYVKEEANRVVHLVDREEWEEAYYARTALCEWIEHKTGIPTLLDIRRHAKYHATQGGVEYLTLFLNQSQVKEALHAEASVIWASCRPPIRLHLAQDTMKSSKPAVERILAAGIPVLLFQGLFDAKDGPASSEAWMRTLSWNDADSFWEAERMVWLVCGRREGYWRQWKNLTHVVVTGAGHQVPADQPEAAAAMIETWVEQHISLERPISHVQIGQAVAVENGKIDEQEIQAELTMEAAMASLGNSAGDQVHARTRL
ncbi:unnamed protein product [Closterium sp. Yama58-4]|nr:unnamed protein product [Closterium sp. Yama58-4]